jgi:large subunit ribosomal protein L19
MGIIERIQAEQIAKWAGAEEGKEGKAHPAFRTGDTLKVHVRIKEGEKERIQIFQGVCIKTRHGSAHKTFTVRKMSSGIGVERVFPLYSPIVEKIEITHRGRVRRSKLYYLRDLSGKKARLKDRDLIRRKNAARSEAKK